MSHSKWQCDLCLTRFTRSEHLRRHLRSHENTRPYECNLCHRSFTRRDVKTRHEKTCRAPPSKKQYDVSQDVARASRTIQESTGSSETAWNEFEAEGEFVRDMLDPSDFTALDWLYSTRTKPDRIISAERLDFLAHFTSENGMGTFLAPNVLRYRQNLILRHERTVGQIVKPSLLHVGSDEIDPLTARTFEIAHHFQTIITGKAKENIVNLTWTANIECLCHSFFSAANITRFLEYFWALWYPNCPFVHRASFDPHVAPAALLCVMLLIGACLSPHPDDPQMARAWLDCVEELTFSDLSFSEEIANASPSTQRYSLEEKKRRLEIMQAAYLVCSLQKREGSTEAKARVRRYRHATMVMLARNFGLVNASHRTLDVDSPSETWWRQFAVEEASVRTTTYIFLFDAALTIFHNSPPRMVVSELRMEVACPEACFQAQSAEECFASLEKWGYSVFWRRHMSIAALVKGICQGELKPEVVDEYAGIGGLNLFTAVQCLHSLTFHLQNSLIFHSTLLPIKTGLDHWRRIWEKHRYDEAEDPRRYVSDEPSTLWKDVEGGFISYASEFWQLAKIVIEGIRADADAVDEDGRKGEGDIEVGRDGVLKGTDRTRIETKVRYDHTDMMDVNGLIMEYRRMSLGARV
ncbi:hypothetical protein BDW74DRAFT_188617 [Aspergillus multicolor]|uniref:transcription factor domain-containing protein n=1 Tax=Aspergillus multicolor TaxID=41759 RepID=UPI003CCCB4BE